MNQDIAYVQINSFNFHFSQILNYLHFHYNFANLNNYNHFDSIHYHYLLIFKALKIFKVISLNSWNLLKIV